MDRPILYRRSYTTLDKCLVWELLLLPSNAQTAPVLFLTIESLSEISNQSPAMRILRNSELELTLPWQQGTSIT